MLEFSDYVNAFIIRKRIEELGCYDYHRVEKNFYKTLKILGDLDKRDLIVNLDIRLKGKSTWDEANCYAETLRTKISQRFWKRKSRFRKLPFIRSIESKVKSNGYIKDHLHIMIRLTEMKQYYEPETIEEIVSSIAYSLDEVNEKDKGNNPAVKVSTFPYWENNKILGRRCEYICKTTTQHYDPIKTNDDEPKRTRNKILESKNYLSISV